MAKASQARLLVTRNVMPAHVLQQLQTDIAAGVIHASQIKMLAWRCACLAVCPVCWGWHMFAAAHVDEYFAASLISSLHHKPAANLRCLS